MSPFSLHKMIGILMSLPQPTQRQRERLEAAKKAEKLHRMNAEARAQKAESRKSFAVSRVVSLDGASYRARETGAPERESTWENGHRRVRMSKKARLRFRRARR